MTIARMKMVMDITVIFLTKKFLKIKMKIEKNQKKIISQMFQKMIWR